MLDRFIVSAVATILAIRVYLRAAGYPQIGGHGLHVAHVLWGGLGMMAAIVISLLFQSPSTRSIVAVVGGAGFGAFVDELGKFLTSDNNYFFKPTAALVYAIFVVIFLAGYRLRRYQRLSPEEDLVNALELAKKLAVGTATETDRHRALGLLAGAGQAAPLTVALRQQFLNADLEPAHPWWLSRLRARASSGYAAIVANPWFRRLVAALFIVEGLVAVLATAAAAALLGGSLVGIKVAQTVLGDASAGSTLTSWIELVAGLIAGGIILVGLFELRRSRFKAYGAFELAILVDLLLSQPFALLDNGFAGAGSVLFDLALLGTLRFMQSQERRLLVRQHASGELPPATARP